MKCIIFVTIFAVCLSFTQSSENDFVLPTNIEEKSNYPGVSAILGAGAGVLEAFVAFATGGGSVDGITAAIQQFFFQIRRMISVQGIVGQIPMFGFILQPLVGIAAMILSNAPMLGGLISYILVGPSES